MTAYTGYVDDTGAFANQNFLQVLHDKLVLEGWSVLRYDTVSEPRELIAKGVGYSGTEEIFIGFRSYQDVGADYYNLSVACFTGYVSGNAFDAQPGYKENSVCGHNLRIDYWLNISPQRVAFTLKIGTPVYQHGYVGKFFPYFTPSQYPYPVACIGMLPGRSTLRFSSDTPTFGYRGSIAQASVRVLSGVWQQADAWPFNSQGVCATTEDVSRGYANQRDTNGTYSLLPVTLMASNTDVYGELEGVYYISGFSNATENTGSDSGKNFVVVQDHNRNGFNDYIALEV